MKKFAFLGIATIALASLILFSTNGCGARGKVAMNKISDAVDKMLGELDVKRQKISDKMDALDQGIKDIRKSKIETEVQADLLKSKKEAQQEELDSANKNLAKVKKLLEQAESSEGGVVKTGSGEEIKKTTLASYAKTLISEQKAISTKMNGFEEAENTLARVVKTLSNKEKKYGDMKDQLKQTLDQIDAKIVAVKAMQSASNKMDGQENLSDSVAQLEKDIEDLGVTVETSLRLEDDKWAESAEAAELESAKSIIESSGESNDLIGEIDDLLNEGK